MISLMLFIPDSVFRMSLVKSSMKLLVPSSSCLRCRSLSTTPVSQGVLKKVNEYIAERKKPVVSVLNLHGIIMAGKSGGLGGGQPKLNIDNTRKLIDKAFDADRLEAVLLSINSPGGSAVQSDLISEHIQYRADKAKVKVTAFVEDMALSGGYWLACAAPEIYVNKASLAGSIGVIFATFGLHEAIGKLGVERRLQTSGPRKACLDPFKPMEEGDKALVKDLCDEIFDVFKDHVKKSRGDRLKGAEEDLFSGAFWAGQKAVDRGLADGVLTSHAFIRREYGDRVRVARIKPDPWAQLFGGAQVRIHQRPHLCSCIYLSVVFYCF